MEATKLPLRTWLLAYHYIVADGVNARQLAARLGVAYMTAWRLHKCIIGEPGVGEGKRLTLYKSASGGPSLFKRKPGEPAPNRKTYVLRGSNVTIAQIAVECHGATVKMVGNRLRAGRTPEEVVAEFARPYSVAVCGNEVQFDDLAKLAEVAPVKLWQRMRRGMTAERAAFGPNKAR